MPRPEHVAALTPVTRSRLAADLERLGVRTGAIAMVHASLSSLDWVVGGSQTVVEALLACLGPHGTLCAQASWEDIPFGHAGWPEEWRTAYEAEFPPFDPRLSAAAPYEGRLAERIRTWPGAHRSANPATPLRTGWTAIRELDVWNGVYPDHELDAIADAALAAGVGRTGLAGAATAHVFPADALTRFAVAWLERRFGASAAPSE